MLRGNHQGACDTDGYRRKGKVSEASRLEIRRKREKAIHVESTIKARVMPVQSTFSQGALNESRRVLL